MAVTKNERVTEDTYDFTCEVENFNGSTCGFTSTRWPTKKAAIERGRQHKAEHESGTPMPELNAQES
jgi:hypothetical protein